MDLHAVNDSAAYSNACPEGNGDDASKDYREECTLLHLIADNANDIIVLLDSNQTILYASGAASRVLGHATDLLLGCHLHDFVHPDDLPVSISPGEWPTGLRQILRFRRSDGEHVLLEPAFRPMQQGKLPRTIGVLRDVTQQVRLEEQLNHQQRMDAIGQLTAGIAHDFNNLLQAMMGSLELLLDEVGDHPDARESAEGALRMGERGARLTHHLLAFARRQVLRPKALTLPDLVQDIVHTLRRTLGPQIVIRIAVSPDVPQVYADAGQLEAAVLNLALNARDAMPKGGTLTIEVAPTEPPLFATLQPLGQAGRYVGVVVSDTGDGMDAETLAHACEPFFTTKGPNGTGLGLSMVHGFAQQSGGDLRIESVAGLGTRIEVRLPVAEETPQPKPSPAPAPAPARATVLLVDDEQEVLVTLGSFLKGAGYTVRTARNGDEALCALANGEAVDAMVTDYAMPGLDGPGLISRARVLMPGLPVLVMSGYAEAERLLDSVAQLRVMRKPFRRMALVQEVAALVEGSRATLGL